MVKKVSIWLTLEPLLYSEEPMHLAEISRVLGKPHTTIRKQLAVFEKMGLISKEQKGRQIFYKLRKIPLLIDYLTVVEKEKLIKICEEDLVIKEIVDFLHTLGNPSLIFGSAVHGSKHSRDIDLLIIDKFKKEKLKPLEKKLNLRLHIINVKKFNEINETLKTEIRRKHLIIQGSEELIKWLID